MAGLTLNISNNQPLDYEEDFTAFFMQLQINRYLMQPVYPFLLTLLFCISCGPDGISPKEELPPATQEGKNTFGCLVNGEVWLPAAVSLNPATQKLSFYYQEQILNISAVRILASKNVKEDIYVRQRNLLEEKEYLLESLESNSGGAGFGDFKKNCFYRTDSLRAGILNIIKLDTINYIIAGTFEFIVWTDECDTIRVTDGRFDIKYQQ